MPNVLVVDDSPIDRVLVEGILKRDPRIKIHSAINGRDGLAKMQSVQPDLVVSDLQMPEMDGLQLVTNMRLHYPQVPVVLITAHGSEELAIQALEQGAASYVPKSQLADKLLDSVDQVLELSRSDRSYEMLAACMREATFRYSLASDPSLVEKLVELIQQISVSMELCDVGGQVRLGMALEEALRLCLYRGNLEFNEDELRRCHFQRGELQPFVEERRREPRFAGRKLHVTVQLSPVRGVFTIRHEGPAIPWQSGEPLGLEGSGDRSLILMRAFVDELVLAPGGQQAQLIIQPPVDRDSSATDSAA